MTKLNQIIAVEKGVKSETKTLVTQLYKIAQKADLFNGMSKRYERLDEEGEDLPPETKKVSCDTNELLIDVKKAMSNYLAITARKDILNTRANANIVVDGVTLLNDVPVTFLLTLEKELTDIKTLVSHLPTLEESEDWNFVQSSNTYKTEESKTHRTKKIQKPIVLYQATEHHPAQTQMITEDVVVGHWKQVKYSSALPKKKKREMLDRIEVFLNAVKTAREEANSIEEVIDVNTITNSIDNFLKKFLSLDV